MNTPHPDSPEYNSEYFFKRVHELRMITPNTKIGKIIKEMCDAEDEILSNSTPEEQKIAYTKFLNIMTLIYTSGQAYIQYLKGLQPKPPEPE